MRKSWSSPALSTEDVTPTASSTDRLDQVNARHSAWYSCDAETPVDYTGEDFGATWKDDLGFVESYEFDKDQPRRQRAMAHEIVREDVPWLIERVRELEAKLVEAGVDIDEGGRDG